jgi:hypothetical protein
MMTNASVGGEEVEAEVEGAVKNEQSVESYGDKVDSCAERPQETDGGTRPSCVVHGARRSQSDSIQGDNIPGDNIPGERLKGNVCPRRSLGPRHGLRTASVRTEFLSPNREIGCA